MPQRKRPILLPGGKWNSKKHANVRTNRSVFEGRYTDTGQRVVSAPLSRVRISNKSGEFKDGQTGTLRRILPKGNAGGLNEKVENKEGLNIGRVILVPDERKTPYRYRKSKK